MYIVTWHVFNLTFYSGVLPLSPFLCAPLCSTDPIDLTQEDNALQKALALSLQDLQTSTGAQISLEDQELSRSVREIGIPAASCPSLTLSLPVLPSSSLFLASRFPLSLSTPLDPSLLLSLHDQSLSELWKPAWQSGRARCNSSVCPSSASRWTPSTHTRGRGRETPPPG